MGCTGTSGRHIHAHTVTHTLTNHNLALCLLYLCQQLVGHCLRKCCFAPFYFLLDPGTGRWTGSWMQSATPQLKSLTLSTVKLKLPMLRRHYVLKHVHLLESHMNTIHRVFFFFFFEDWKMEMRRYAWKATKDPHRQSHDTVRKPKSVLAFISDTKEETVDKSWANFAESPRREIKTKTTVSELFTWGSTEHDSLPLVSKAEPKQISN